MGATVAVNDQTVVHKNSGGTIVASPDVCNTPVGPAVVQVPYINIGKSSDTSQGSNTVTMDGNPVMLSDSVFDTSYGDEPGKLGGIVSGTNKGKAKFITTSNDVIVEGKTIGRRLDAMTSNRSGSGNTPPSALQQQNTSAKEKDGNGYDLVLSFKFEHQNETATLDDPRLKLHYTISGPETFQYKEKEVYKLVERKMAQTGTYSFTVDDSMLEEMSVTQEAKDKQPT